VAPSQEPEIKFIGANVARLRIRAGLTQSGLAEKAGLSSRAVSIVEGGLADLSVSTLCKLARGLGVTPIRLMRKTQGRARPGRGAPKKR
jgi:transcriptional regulator with XRE-family HTH domain